MDETVWRQEESVCKVFQWPGIQRLALQSLRLVAKERWQYQHLERSSQFLHDNQDVQWGQANCPQSCAKKGHWRDSPGLAMV
jgi:hypothetical protein